MNALRGYASGFSKQRRLFELEEFWFKWISDASEGGPVRFVDCDGHDRGRCCPWSTGQNPTSVIGTVRRQVQALDNNLPFSGAETPKQELDEYLGEERSLAALLSTFGALALILTAVGLYGTISYTVSRRTREMGIRIALGARRDNLLWMVLRETSGTVTIGVAIGTAASLIAARLIASRLFGVGMSDPMTISIVILFMFATALAAAYIPARRATNVDPMEALRHE